MAVFWVLAAAALVLGLFLYMIAPARMEERRLDPYRGQYFAHRGCFTIDQSIPENSIPAFQRAVELHYGVELDVQLTRDEQLAVFHDATLKRVCGVDARVDAWTYEDLKQKLTLFDSDEHIPLFSEVLQVLGGRAPVIVELKTGGNWRLNCKKTLKMLRDYHGEYCVESFDPRIVRFFKKNAPDIMRGQLVERFSQNKKRVGVFAAFILSRTMLNFLTRPNFIAYDGAPQYGLKPWPVRLSERMGAFRVMYTDEPEYDQKLLQKQYDLLIFQHFTPPKHFEN